MPPLSISRAAITFSAQDFEVNDHYLGGGYAVMGEPEREAIRLCAQTEGLLVDPVYTGRAMAGLIDLIRAGEFRPGQNVLFWHTGGTPALFAYASAAHRVKRGGKQNEAARTRRAASFVYHAPTECTKSIRRKSSSGW